MVMYVSNQSERLFQILYKLSRARTEQIHTTPTTRKPILNKNAEDCLCRDIEYSISNGANPNFQQNHISLLHLAVLCGLTPVIETLRKNGADVEIRDALGDTPLITAIKTDQIDIADSLCWNLKISVNGQDKIIKGANVNAQNNAGDTALHFAIEHRNIEAVAFLVEGHQARTDIQNHLKASPKRLTIDLLNRAQAQRSTFRNDLDRAYQHNNEVFIQKAAPKHHHAQNDVAIFTEIKHILERREQMAYNYHQLLYKVNHRGKQNG